MQQRSQYTGASVWPSVSGTSAFQPNGPGGEQCASGGGALTFFEAQERAGTGRTGRARARWIARRTRMHPRAESRGEARPRPATALTSARGRWEALLRLLAASRGALCWRTRCGGKGGRASAGAYGAGARGGARVLRRGAPLTQDACHRPLVFCEICDKEVLPL